MTNEQFLIVSYFCVAAIAVAIGFVAYFWLRAPLQEVSAALPWKVFRELLSRLFPVGMVFPALLGFVSVSYRGCKRQEYEKIVADRFYLVSKSQEQISASLIHVVWAVFAWCALIAILVAMKRRSDQRAASSFAENK
jgi:hypothetical protein